jgi:hypothetical protein
MVKNEIDAVLNLADTLNQRVIGFLKLAHVDGDDVLLAAVQRLGQRQRGFGFADAGGGAW